MKGDIKGDYLSQQMAEAYTPYKASVELEFSYLN